MQSECNRQVRSGRVTDLEGHLMQRFPSHHPIVLACLHCVVLCCVVCTHTPVITTETSPLWGCSGESWVRGGLLEDWSFAGYGAGMEAIPSPPVTVDVKKDFHATGSGVTDDTAAVKAAIEATKDTGGVIYFPPGK